MNVAVYLNPENVEADWSIWVHENDLQIGAAYVNYGQCKFINKSRAKIAISILGEDVIKLALS